MILHTKYPVTCEDKNYEIRVLHENNIINVVAFLNNYPANGFRHQIKVPERFDIKTILKTDIIKEKETFQRICRQ